MSLHCPQCGGLVYARNNSKCGYCGADLPTEFRFTEAELAAEAERVKRLNKEPKPRFPVFAISCWGVCVVGFVVLALVYHRWVDWLWGALWVGAIIEHLVKYSRQKKHYEVQNHDSPAGAKCE